MYILRKWSQAAKLAQYWFWNRFTHSHTSFFFFFLSMQFSGQSKYFYCVTQTNQKALWTVSWSWHLCVPRDISESARLTIVWWFCWNWGGQDWTGWTAVFCSALVLKPRALQCNVIFQGHARRRWLLEVITSVQEKIAYTQRTFHWEMPGNKKKTVWDVFIITLELFINEISNTSLSKAAFLLPVSHFSEFCFE